MKVHNITKHKNFRDTISSEIKPHDTITVSARALHRGVTLVRIKASNIFRYVRHQFTSFSTHAVLNFSTPLPHSRCPQTSRFFPVHSHPVHKFSKEVSILQISLLRFCKNFSRQLCKQYVPPICTLVDLITLIIMTHNNRGVHII
jgi:hypothetical protein